MYSSPFSRILEPQERQAGSLHHKGAKTHALLDGPPTDQDVAA